MELQTEVGAPRVAVYDLLATAEGLARWLEEVDLEARVGRPVRFRLQDAVAVGVVVAVDVPQHISFTWDWEGAPLGATTVVAFDAIDHGDRTHVTLRHVGFLTRRQREEHEALWRYWFGRFPAAAEAYQPKVELTHP